MKELIILPLKDISQFVKVECVCVCGVSMHMCWPNPEMVPFEKQLKE